jgi:hypothetical protein
MRQNVEQRARIETEARRMARSGAYLEFSAILLRLKERGFAEADRVFENPWTQAEIDRLCHLARQDYAVAA